MHQHTPEMEQSLSRGGRHRRHAVVHAGARADAARDPRHLHRPAGAPGPTEAALREALHAAYDDEPFVHVLPEGTWPTTAATLGSNSVHLQVAADRHSGRAVVVAALDNLVKGAAGQAVQNANLVLGLDETAGLTRRTVSRRERHQRPHGLPGRGGRRRAEGQRPARRRPRRQRRAGTAAAGVFTANRVKAAPVVWTQQVVRDGRVDAVVLNSGGANACTGPAGFQDTHATAE